MTLPEEARSEEITFQLATLLLRGETLEMVDDAGRTWEATASTLQRRSGPDTEVLLERANAFDVLSALAAGLSNAPPPAADTPPEYALALYGLLD